jgi:hypothetical protein
MVKCREPDGDSSGNPKLASPIARLAGQWYMRHVRAERGWGKKLSAKAGIENARRWAREPRAPLESQRCDKPMTGKTALTMRCSSAGTASANTSDYAFSAHIHK